MKDTVKIIFVITVLGLFSLPIIFFDAKSEISQKENRTLEKKPLLMKENHLNGNFFAEYDAYFQDHLGFREQLIQLDASNPLKVKISTAAKAIVGKDGWYFFTDIDDGNNLIDFYKRNLFEPIQIQKFSEIISKTVEWCKAQNIKCLFLIGPNKHSVYEEFYPYERPEGITRADQIVQIFDELGVSYIFPRDYLISQKAKYDFPLYYETDTHWNSQGAYLAFTLLRNKICSLFPNIVFPHLEYETSISESNTYGDLLPLLNLANGKSTQIKHTPKGHTNSEFYSFIPNNDINGLQTKGTDDKLPRALIYSDSFIGALEPFVSPLFSEIEYHWERFTESDKDYVLKYKPDIVIFEVVERNAPKIILQ